MKLFFLTLLTAASIPWTAVAGEIETYGARGKDWGLGFTLGSVTGVSAELRTGTNHDAVDLAIGAPGDLTITGDYLIHMTAFRFRNVEHPFFWGFGGYARLSKNTDLAIRVPFNMHFYFGKDERFQFFFMAAPMLRVAPALSAEGAIGLGLRYFL